MNNNSLSIICIATLLSFHSNHYYLATLRIQFAAIILHKNNLTTLIAAAMVKDSRYMNASRYGTNRGKIRFVCRENLSTLMKHKIAHLNLRESPVNVMLEEPLRWCLVKWQWQQIIRMMSKLTLIKGKKKKSLIDLIADRMWVLKWIKCHMLSEREY